jgi:hypothetical protein
MLKSIELLHDLDGLMEATRVATFAEADLLIEAIRETRLELAVAVAEENEEILGVPLPVEMAWVREEAVS